MENVLTSNKLEKCLNFFFIFLFVFVFVTFFSPLPLTAQTEQEHKPLHYDLSVKALQVPFVAVDSRGRPVFDLKQEELELVVNGKSLDILYLYGLAFRDAEIPAEKEEAQPAAEVKAKPIPVKQVTRLKFIIVDALFNSPLGLKNSKALARQLIENCDPQDRFVLLEIRLGGLKYIAGPEPGGKPFLEHFAKLRKNPQKLVWWDRPEHPHRDGWDVERFLMEDSLKNARRDTVKMYLDAFEQFKNALRTIDNPKVTFLLSEGFAGHVDDSFVKNPLHHRLFSYMGFEKDMVKEVHEGGSVLQKVHVGSLRSQDSKPLAAWLNKSTAAYYELSFNPGPRAGEKMDIRIKCKRRGVRINAVAYKEKDKPYQEMNKVQKKLFAVNVATGRSYSRILGRVSLSFFKKIKEEKIGNETGVVVQVPIPDAMKDRSVDVFALRFDDKYQDVDVAWSQRVAKERETITLPTGKNKKHLYFVIVEPSTAFCIYNKIR